MPGDTTWIQGISPSLPREADQNEAIEGEEPEILVENAYLDPSDARLLRRIRRGDERAFAQLVYQYQDRVYGLCLRMLGNPEEAEDLAQEIFVAVYQHIDRFRAEAQLSTWIFKVARNRCLNRLKYLGRRAHKRRDGLEDVGEGRLHDAAASTPVRPDLHYDGQELQSVLQEALLELPDEQRMLVLLRDVDGLSYDEIARVCELPGGTVKSRIHRARQTLAQAVKAWRGSTEDDDDERGGTP